MGARAGAPTNMGWLNPSFRGGAASGHVKLHARWCARYVYLPHTLSLKPERGLFHVVELANMHKPKAL